MSKADKAGMEVRERAMASKSAKNPMYGVGGAEPRGFARLARPLALISGGVSGRVPPGAMPLVMPLSRTPTPADTFYPVGVSVGVSVGRRQRERVNGARGHGAG